MASDDREHWLWRLDADAWLRAAEVELTAGAANLASRRTAITHARRAAGMALNAVLVVTTAPGDELRWGRSYLDHLRAVADAPEQALQPLPASVRQLAARLLAIAVVPTVVQLGRGPHSAAEQALELARGLQAECRAVVARSGPTPPSPAAR